MATLERLITIENTSDEAISDMWDSVPYHFAPGERTTLRYGVGLLFSSRYPGVLNVVAESEGFAPDVVLHTKTLVNRHSSFVDLMWDGMQYHLEPGSQLTTEAGIADSLILQARTQGVAVVEEGTEVSTSPLPEGVPQEPINVAGLAKELDLTVSSVKKGLDTLGVTALNGKTIVDDAIAGQLRAEVAARLAVGPVIDWDKAREQV